MFLPGARPGAFVVVKDVEFTWHPGLAPSQKRKSIASLHEAVARAGTAARPLEVSSKSPEAAGVRLSAFNLRFASPGWPACAVEAAFQSSKVFERGGPYRDIAAMPSRDAKRDARLRSSGDLVAFDFRGEHWGLLPRTMFYDWLYLNALAQSPDLAGAVVPRDAFTDIEFNPERSVNCQARSAALFVALTRLGLLQDALDSPARYKEVLRSGASPNQTVQGRMF